jgi:hypothetical protein
MMLNRLLRHFVTRQEVENKIVELTKRYVTKEFSLDASYEELGLTKINIMEILALAEVELRASELDNNDILNVKTIPDAIEIFLKNPNN